MHILCWTVSVSSTWPQTAEQQSLYKFASVPFERNETPLARNEEHLARNARLVTSERRGGKLPFTGTIYGILVVN